MFALLFVPVFFGIFQVVTTLALFIAYKVFGGQKKFLEWRKKMADTGKW